MSESGGEPVTRSVELLKELFREKLIDGFVDVERENIRLRAALQRSKKLRGPDYVTLWERPDGDFLVRSKEEDRKGWIRSYVAYATSGCGDSAGYHRKIVHNAAALWDEVERFFEDEKKATADHYG